MSGPALDGFPEAPKGDPGGIRSAARRLDHAHDRLHDVAAGLHATSDGLAQDWDGDAAGRYRLAVQGLASAARGAAGTFADCSSCASDYADALEKAQDELRQLRTKYDAAKQRAADAAASAMSIGTAMAMPDAPEHLSDDLSRAQDAESAANDDATRILQRAQDVLDDFHAAERTAQAALGGQDAGGAPGMGSPFGGGLMPGRGVGNGISPGFGIPLGGLAPFDGTIRVGDPWNSGIPGFGTFWDGTHPSAEPVDDLTNVILFAAGGVEMVGWNGLKAAAAELASAFGATSARQAAKKAGSEAFEKALALGEGGAVRAGSFRGRLQAAREAENKASAAAQVAIRNRRADALDRAWELADKLGLKTPTGLRETAVHLYRYSSEVRYKAMFQLLRLRAAAAEHGPAGAALARALDRFMGIG
jgi:uncharacterized protein YukE